MSKEKKKDKKSGKNAQLVIRVQKEERAAFVKLCDSLDSSAAREIRLFMREFVASKTATEEAVKVNALPEKTHPVTLKGVAAAKKEAVTAPETQGVTA